MRFFVTVLALFALLAPQAAQAKGGGAPQRSPSAPPSPTASRVTSATSSSPNPGIGVAHQRRRAWSCSTASPAARSPTLPAPPGGFKLPFTLRVPRSGHLVVLDSGGFPPVGPPVVYDYDYGTERHGFKAKLTRTVDFAGNPLGFAEDVEVLPNGEYVVSESIFGGLWLIGRDGKIRRGLVPDDGGPALPNLGPCQFPAAAPAPSAACRSRRPAASRPAPARSRSATRSCTSARPARAASSGCAIRTLLDTQQAGRRARGEDHDRHAKRKNDLESLKGITFNRWDPNDPWIYAGDPFQLTADPRSTRAPASARCSPTTRKLFNFTVSTAFLPPVAPRRGEPAGDRERPGVPLERRSTPRSTASTSSSRRSSSPSTPEALALGALGATAPAERRRGRLSPWA